MSSSLEGSLRVLASACTTAIDLVREVYEWAKVPLPSALQGQLPDVPELFTELAQQVVARCSHLGAGCGITPLGTRASTELVTGAVKIR